MGRSDGKGGLIDNLSLTATSYSSPNLVKNPSFEQHGEFDQPKSGGRETAEGIVKLKLDSKKHNNYIEQTLATQAGKRYQFSLSYAPSKNKQNSDNVEVFWNEKMSKKGVPKKGTAELSYMIFII